MKAENKAPRLSFPRVAKPGAKAFISYDDIIAWERKRARATGN